MSRKIGFWLFLALMAPSLGFASGDGGHEKAKGPSPDEALSWLQDGNRRFLSGAPLTTNLSSQRRLDTAKGGQHPFVTVLGCSDSRVPLESIFHVGVGDLFAVRVAGNVADTDEIGTIEYGVEHLGTPLLVVLGHSSCGAVTAVVKGSKVEGSIPELVDNIAPAVARARQGKHGDEGALIDASIHENVWQSIADLLRRSPLTAELVKEGKLKIIGAHYRIDSGEIEWMGAHPDERKLLSGAAKHESHGMPWVSSLALSGALLLWLLACFFLFVADRRLCKSLKFKGRFFLALASFALAAVMMVAVALGQTGLRGVWNGVVFSLLPATTLLLMALLYTLSVRKSLHKYIADMRAKLSETPPAD